MNNPKADLNNIIVHIKYGETPLWFTRYCPEMKIWMHCRQITVKNGRILPNNNPNAGLYNINAHIKYGENP